MFEDEKMGEGKEPAENKNLVKKKLLAERYEFSEKIGAGGEGTVYKGFDVRLGIDVAVKQFVSEKMFYENFSSKEISFAHPSFPRITDIICEEGCKYLVMDYIDGQNGAEFVQNCGVLKGDKIRDVAIRICNAMKYLHDVKKVLHCDLKPENLIFCSNGEIKLVDISCLDLEDAKESSAKVKRDDNLEYQLLGTPGYVAPEVCSFNRHTKISDVFAFGATLYFLCTGKTPNLDKFNFPSLFNQQIDKLVEDVIIICLKQEPSERFSSFEKVIKQLTSENVVSTSFRNLTLNFMNNAELAFEYAYVISKKLNKQVLVGITNKAYQLLDERLVFFDTHNAVSLIQSIESENEQYDERHDLREFAVQPNGMRGVYALVIPEQVEIKDKAKKYLLNHAKEFDSLIFVSLMENGLDADINILGLPENNFEAQAIINNIDRLESNTDNFRYVVFDGILSLTEIKNNFCNSINEKIIAIIQRVSQRSDARLFGGIITNHMQREMELAYLQLAKELGVNGAEVAEGEQNAYGNKFWRHSRNEEGTSLWKYKMGGNKNGSRH